jgi:phospholipid/cholesterol/gamma-HCH transport system substrate-binding protein
MKLLADRDERFKGLFAKVGIFILLAVAVVAFNLFFTGVKKGLFNPKSAIYFLVDSAEDIKEGMPVKLSGFKIGSVKNIALDSVAHAKVEMSIDNQYLSLLNDDAMVSLKKEGVIGDSILEAKRGTEGKGQLSAGAIIRFERGGGLEQIAQDMRDRLVPAMDEVNKLLRSTNDPHGDIRQTLKNVREFTGELRDTRAKIDRTLDQVHEGIDKDVRPMLHSIHLATEHAESMTGKLDKEFPVMIDKVDATLDNIHHTTETLKSAVDNAAPQLTGVIGESRSLISGTRNIEDSLSASWPLKNIMQQPEQGLLKMDSHD